MKKKFNAKLTIFLVSLFVSLIILILGNKNKYCLSFGFILLSLSLVLFVFYYNDKTIKDSSAIDAEIEEMEEDEEIFEDEKIYSLQQLYQIKSKMQKHKKRVNVTFYLCAALLMLVAIIGMF